MVLSIEGTYNDINCFVHIPIWVVVHSSNRIRRLSLFWGGSASNYDLDSPGATNGVKKSTLIEFHETKDSEEGNERCNAVVFVRIFRNACCKPEASLDWLKIRKRGLTTSIADR